MDLPKLIENPEFQAIFAQKIAVFTAACRAGITPDFPEPTPADPSWHHLAQLSLSELIIREKTNAAAYAQLTALSNEMEFIYKRSIRDGESYEAFRDRMRGLKYESASAGTPQMYKALTFLYGESKVGHGENSRTVMVMDCHVQNVAGDLLIHVLTNAEDQDSNAAVIKSLTDAFKKDSVKPVLDVVAFKAAAAVPFVINATILLMSGYGVDYKATIEKTFREKFESRKSLGWAPSVSWIIRELHQAGVKSVSMRSPSNNIVVPPERYASISKIDISLEFEP
jgi:phage-related baseplate assembly protein